jgi:hypothetical protein
MPPKNKIVHLFQMRGVFHISSAWLHNLCLDILVGSPHRQSGPKSRSASWLEACPRYAQNQVLSAQSGQDPGSGYLLRKIFGNLAPKGPEFLVYPLNFWLNMRGFRARLKK